MMFSKPPLVSVIVASYNHAAFVMTAVRSVLEQDYGDIEVLVIDDGSCDGTPDIVESIKDPRVRLVRLEQNRRVHSRNAGLRTSRGSYIAFQNSDDEWASGKLNAQINVLERHKNVVACFTGVEIVDEDGKQLSDSFAHGIFSTENRENTVWLRRFFDAGNCLCLSSVVVRRSAINAVGHFRPSLVQLSDLDLWVRLAGIGDFHIIDSHLTRMRIIHDKNVSRPTSANSKRSQIEYGEVLWRYTEHPICDQIYKAFSDVIPKSAKSIHTRLAGLALYAWRLGDPCHCMFADRVLAWLLDDDAVREEVVALYGTKVVHEFIMRRGELKVITDNDKRIHISALVKTSIRVILNEGWPSFFRKLKVWLRYR
ncbi:glycosyltransferase family 2 protein [Chloroflexota bacterium]